MGAIKKVRLSDFSADQAAKIPIDDRKVEAELDQLVVAVNNSSKTLTSADSPYTVAADAEYDVYLCDASGGAITITLDAAADHTDEKITFVKTDSSAGAVTPNGVSLANQNESVSFVSDGTTWNALSGGSGAAFSVHKNGVGQTISAGTTEFLTWASEDYDRGPCFGLDALGSNAAANRFAPGVAEIYRLVVTVQFSVVEGATSSLLTIYKNGVVYKHVRVQASVALYNVPFLLVCDVEANGTTDYFEVSFTNGSSVAGSVKGDITYSYFQGSRVA